MQNMEKKEYTGDFAVLPLEMHIAIFDYLDDRELALYRLVCRFWRGAIESFYETYIELFNDNWEIFLRESTGNKLRVRTIDLAYPIFEAFPFYDFICRIQVLEFSGFIPIYNIIEILRRLEKLNSLAIIDARLDRHHIDSAHGIEWFPNLRLKKLNLSSVSSELETEDLILLTNCLGRIILSNSMIELNLSDDYSIKTLTNLIYNEIFGAIEDEPGMSPLLLTKYDSIMKIITAQQKSLKRIRFSHRYNMLPKKPETYFKFHQASTIPFQIDKSCLFKSTAQFSMAFPDLENQLGVEDVLAIYQNQTNMRNLKVMFKTDDDLKRIEKMIKHNSKTLETVEIHSVESGVTYRKFNSKIFRSCKKLRKLALKSGDFYRFCQIIKFDELPNSIKDLKLLGFVPNMSYSHELMNLGEGGLQWQHFKNLQNLTLDQLPWFFLDSTPIRVMRVKHFRFLLNVLPNLKLLRMITIVLENVLELRVASILGIDLLDPPVSNELIQWILDPKEHGNYSITLKETQLTHVDKTVYSVSIQSLK